MQIQQVEIELPNNILAICVNTSTVSLKAWMVRNMALGGLSKIEAARNEAAAEALREAMEEECVHRIPLLGFAYLRHKRYPNIEIARRYAPQVQLASIRGYGAFNTCTQLLRMANFFVDNHQHDKEMIISLADFQSLDTESIQAPSGTT